MNGISDQIKSGARSFLVTEYKYLSVFVIAIVITLFVFYTTTTTAENGTMEGLKYSLSFLAGAIFSAASGWSGMVAATDANVRTTNAASSSGLNAALRVAFTGGAVAGFMVVGLGIAGLSIVFYVLTLFVEGDIDDVDTAARLTMAADALAGFGFGASSIALFSRVAGGIYTKAADVGKCSVNWSCARPMYTPLFFSH